jgi:hypothetical protein
MKTVPLIAVDVKRDAMTMLPLTVPSHELPILRRVHGKENVYTSVNRDAGSTELDAETEAARLVAKYGQAAVVAAYGEDFEEKLAEAVSSIDTSKKPRAAVAA